MSQPSHSSLSSKSLPASINPNPYTPPNANSNSHSNAPLRIAINGFGRIGRNVVRALIERQMVFDQPLLGNTVELVAINDIADADTLLHLLKFDSTHGRLSRLGVNAHIETHSDKTNQSLVLTLGEQTHRITIFKEPNPQTLPWAKLGIDVVLECTGLFRSYMGASTHLQAGAKQVIVGAAPFDAVDACIVMGVNNAELTRELPIISSVSCTTQALVPLIHVLDTAFGAKSVLMTEIHAVTADQNVLDQPHRDLRRARASGHNIIPTTSSSIAATIRTLPHMAGRINGHSLRVPTLDVAAIDVNFLFEQSPNVNEVRACLLDACQTNRPLFGIMGFTDEPLVSSDFVHRPESLIIDGSQIMQTGEMADSKQTKVFAWYDNEWGYANRLVDMCIKLASV